MLSADIFFGSDRAGFSSLVRFCTSIPGLSQDSGRVRFSQFFPETRVESGQGCVSPTFPETRVGSGQVESGLGKFDLS